ncbi:ADP-ribosylglycohydrolase family protein [Ammonicoccus fulvus]|uniref:ADP-ribosylglycohydrolase family protein n=1 Tax=Ammonicoccus fulvus TaxID=3138240 RepID=A0ABZ3FQY9_9ACTN
MDDVVADRAAGVLLGQAVGDALGVPYEFGTTRLEGEAKMLGGGLGGYRPGQYSDDTEMAVCIAQVSCDGHDLTSEEALTLVAHRFMAWRRTDPPDIGVQTRAVLGDGAEVSGEELTARARAYFERTGRAAGNGGLMRTGIVGLSRLDDREATAAAARAVCELTHADPLAPESCVLWSEAVRVAVLEGRFDVRGGLDLLPADRVAYWSERLDEADAGPAARFTANGFTVVALQAAWAAIRETDPVGAGEEAPLEGPSAEDGSDRAEQIRIGQLHIRAALQRAIEIGNDTDTVAAIAGTLLGARYGAAALPWEWVEQINGWPELTASSLVGLAHATARHGRA